MYFQIRKYEFDVNKTYFYRLRNQAAAILVHSFGWFEGEFMWVYF